MACIQGLFRRMCCQHSRLPMRLERLHGARLESGLQREIQTALPALGSSRLRDRACHDVALMTQRGARRQRQQGDASVAWRRPFLPRADSIRLMQADAGRCHQHGVEIPATGRVGPNAAADVSPHNWRCAVHHKHNSFSHVVRHLGGAAGLSEAWYAERLETGHRKSPATRSHPPP